MQTFPYTAKARLQAVLGQAVDTILPPRCIVTGETVERQGMISPKAWVELDFIARPFCNSCGFPFDFEVDGSEAECTSCLQYDPLYATARSALHYNETSRYIILGFKHADKTHLVKAFVPWLKRAGEEMLEKADYIMPVPLHHWRLISRRYNQSALIAQALAKDTGIDYLPDGLQRIRATPSQGYLTAKERFKNVKRAFAVTPKHENSIKGKVIVLVDDVYTTGATVGECSKALLKEGAKEVHVLTLARVVRPGQY